jgi:hypothetical protein
LENNESEITCASFLKRYSYILQSNLEKPFTTTAQPHLFISEVSQPASGTETALEANLTEVSVTVPRSLLESETSTILDALESTIWWEPTPAYIKNFSEVLLIQLKREDYECGAGVEVLRKLPMGRFASENYQTAMDKIRERKGIKDILQKLTTRGEELCYIYKDGTKYKARDILMATVEFIQEMEGKKVENVDAEDDEDGSRMDIDTEKVFPEISEQLMSSIHSLNHELDGMLYDSLSTDLGIRANAIRMADRLRTIMDFPTSTTKTVVTEGQTPQTVSMSLVYDLRGLIIDKGLFYFSQWEHITNPYKRRLAWYRVVSIEAPDICRVAEDEVLTSARDRGQNGVLTVYLRDDVPENIERVLPPDYIRV